MRLLALVSRVPLHHVTLDTRKWLAARQTAECAARLVAGPLRYVPPYHSYPRSDQYPPLRCGMNVTRTRYLVFLYPSFTGECTRAGAPWFGPSQRPSMA